MHQPIASNYRADDAGNPAGGTTTATGLAITWQDGPLLVPVEGVRPEDCPTPAYHQSHHYCPSCTWTSRGPAMRRREPNGCFVETVIAAAVDRLEFYQASKFASPYNAEALDHLGKALAALGRRTADREARGVEGTHAV